MGLSCVSRGYGVEEVVEHPGLVLVDLLAFLESDFDQAVQVFFELAVEVAHG
jgi:hypothetical protein